MKFIYLVLFYTFAAFVGSVATSGSVGNFGSVAGSGVGSRIEILSNFFIGNNQLLKLV